jgi:probable DNA repair protein
MPAAFAHIPVQHLDDIAECLVVTPNERLAREFSNAFDLAKLDAGATVWPTLHCMSLRRFWRQQFTQLQGTDLRRPKLLTEQEINLRFQQSAPEGFAQQCRAAVAAWHLTRGYDIDLHSAYMGGERGQYFAQWCAAAVPEDPEFTICEADLPGILSKRIEAITGLRGQRLLLIDIEHLTPAENAFFQLLDETDFAPVNILQGGNWISGFRPDLGSGESFSLEGSSALAPSLDSSAPRLPLVDIAGYGSIGEELMAAASWTREKYLSEPNATIGVVVPDLSANYDRTLRQFTATLTPQGDSRTPAFDLSGGKSLVSQPVWRHARIYLDWLRQPADQKTLAPLLHSPYLSLPWCDSLQSGWPAWARRKIASTAMLQDEAASELKVLIAELPSRARLDVWADHLQGLLACGGWPRTQELGSVQFQAATRIQSVLGELASEPTNTLITWPDALELIDWALDQTFAPQRQASNIQILGMLETTGLNFDYLWVCGMSAEQFPGKANVSPFIPRSAAVAHGLPRSTQDQELAFAQRTLRSWVSRSRQLRMSYTHTLNGARVHHTPLVEARNPAQSAPVESMATLGNRHPFLVSNGIEPLIHEDRHGTPIGPGLIKGGSHRLEAQAQCAFKAFASYRLGLDQSPEPRDFLNAMERGSALHWVFEQLYQRFPEPEIARSQPSEVLQTLCRQAIHRYPHLPETFVETEQRRLYQLVSTFLTLETQRRPFEVLQTEARYVLDLGNLSFALRIDRLDKVDDAIVVIDYKTGKASVGGVQDTLLAPQLPCYSIIRKDIAGVYYAQIRDGDCKVVGLSDDELQLVETKNRSIKTAVTTVGWQQQRLQWTQQLQSLAACIEAGDAAVNPQPNTCRYCHLKPLCRVGEKQQAESVIEKP